MDNSNPKTCCFQNAISSHVYYGSIDVVTGGEYAEQGHMSLFDGFNMLAFKRMDLDKLKTITEHLPSGYTLKHVDDMAMITYPPNVYYLKPDAQSDVWNQLSSLCSISPCAGMRLAFRKAQAFEKLMTVCDPKALVCGTFAELSKVIGSGVYYTSYRLALNNLDSKKTYFIKANGHYSMRLCPTFQELLRAAGYVEFPIWENLALEMTYTFGVE